MLPPRRRARARERAAGPGEHEGDDDDDENDDAEAVEAGMGCVRLFSMVSETFSPFFCLCSPHFS